MIWILVFAHVRDSRERGSEGSSVSGVLQHTKCRREAGRAGRRVMEVSLQLREASLGGSSGSSVSGVSEQFSSLRAGGRAGKLVS